MHRVFWLSAVYAVFWQEMCVLCSGSQVHLSVGSMRCEGSVLAVSGACCVLSVKCICVVSVRRVCRTLAFGVL